MRMVSLLVTSSLAALGVFGSSATGTSVGCEVLQQYLTARSDLQTLDTAARQQAAKEWLGRLMPIVEDQQCGTGLASARWHAMMLARSVDEWDIALDLGQSGLQTATLAAEQAMWQGSVANIAYQKRVKGEPVSTRVAMSEVDRFLALAPALGSADRPGATPPWLIPVVDALVAKANCQRELGDFVGAALTEQRVAMTYVSAGVASDTRLGGFLPEEALSRSCVDLIRAGRYADAASAIAAIRNLTGHVRPAGQHAWNCLGEVAEADKVVAFVQELLTQMPRDEWMVMVCLDAATIVHLSSRDAARDALALQFTDEVTFDAGAMERADLRLSEVQSIAGVPAASALSHRTRMLQARVQLAVDLRDRATAQAAINLLTARGELRDWCEQMMQRLPAE